MKQISVVILPKNDDLLSVSQHDHDAIVDSAYGFIEILFATLERTFKSKTTKANKPSA